MNQPIILLILKALEGRGAERMVTTLARAYADMGYRVHVLCLEDTQEMLLDTRVHHHVVPYYQPPLQDELAQAAAYQEVAKRIDRYVLVNIGEPDLILANIYKINWIMAYSQLPNIINVLHTALSRQFKDALATQPTQTIRHLSMVYSAHPCSCVSEGARQDLLNLIGNSNRTTTIYNPCDVEAIKEAATKPNALEQFGLASKHYMIHVASFDLMKGHHDLLHAYAKTNRKLPLVLVGKGKLENDIKALAVKLGINDKVIFLGYQANPYPLIQQAAVMVLASKFEGFGYVIVEAQALGVPVVSTDCPFGPRELLPAQNLVALDDMTGLADLLERAMVKPETFYTRLNPGLLPKAIARQYLRFADITI